MRPTRILGRAIGLFVACSIPSWAQATNVAHWAADGSVRRAYALVEIAAVNAVVGGTIAGLARRARGGRFLDGFAGGVAGGLLAYAGKDLSSRRWDGAGFVGRQVHAAGASIVARAAVPPPSREPFLMPLGIILLQFGTETACGSDSVIARRVRVKLDLAAVVLATSYGIRRDTRFDARSSASAGALVYRTERWPYASGRGAELAGVILLRDDSIARTFIRPALDTAFSHERIHVPHDDFADIVLARRAEACLARSIPGLRRLEPWVELGLGTMLIGALNMMVRYDDRPWEREARVLTR